MRFWVSLTVSLALAGPALAVAPPPLAKRDRAEGAPGEIRKGFFAEDVCAIISAEADRRGLPPQFFAKLIWKESMFDPGAVSPKGAEGIAQFMPFTAKERGLADAFAPEQALPASASLLSDHRDQFGNVGLAAAAYNAGGGAVAKWLSGASAALPYETQDYVAFITGRAVDDWKEPSSQHEIEPLSKTRGFADACVALVKRELRPMRTPAVALAKWQPWGVVLAGGFSEARALKAFATIRKRYAALLSGKKPMVIRKKNAMGRRKLTNVMVGYGNRAEADAMCAKLQNLGAACMVVKND